MNNHIRQSRRKAGRAAGFSLVEILVVLAILVVGVLGIIRIFPYGFLAIQRTADQTNAAALTNQQIEAEKNAVSVPESIVSMAPDGTVNPNIQPDNLNPEPLDPLNNPNVLTSDVNKINRIIGETLRIPTAFGSPDTKTNYGAVYVAQFGPIYFDAGNAANALNPQVSGTPMQRVEQTAFDATSPGLLDANGNNTLPNVNSAAAYAIDYDRMMIAFYPRTGDGTKSRTFQFNYTYYTKTAGVPGVKTILTTNNQIVVPDVTIPSNDPLFVPVWQPIFVPATPVLNPPQATMPTDMDLSLGIRRGSEEVSRAFKLVASTVTAGTAPTWTDDPYEYAMYSASYTGNGNVGIFLFNPIGHNETIVTPTGTQPLSARISYQIYDNHIVRDQRSLPAVAPFDVRLSLPYVSTTGDVQLDQTTYNGLFGGNSDNMLIYNANNGQLITKGSGECLPGTTPSGVIGGQDNFTVDAKTGVVHFTSAFITANNLQNVTLRIYYHTQKNFGQQLQKANAHYYAADSQATLAYNNYFVPKTGTRIYFAKCETGKTVTLGVLNVYLKNSDGTEMATPTNFSGETYQITNTTGGQPYVDIMDRHSDISRFADDASGLTPVDNIQGISMKSRVIWLRSVQLSQDPTPVATYHWRKLDTDTILTPNPTH